MRATWLSRTFHRSFYSLAPGLVLASLLTGGSVEAARCPNVHIILDRSGSMSASMPVGGTRWNVAKEAVKAVLSKYNGKLPIGMSIFPSSSCDSRLITEPVYGSQAAIEAAIASLMPTGSTPSGTAVRDAQALGALNDPKRAQYIILITDGGPGCSGEPDSCAGTVGEITKARMKSPSISTFVVGFGGGLAASESSCLTQMAAAGGKPTSSAEKYYKADTADELNRALAEILKVVTGGGEAGTGDGVCYR